MCLLYLPPSHVMCELCGSVSHFLALHYASLEPITHRNRNLGSAGRSKFTIVFVVSLFIACKLTSHRFFLFTLLYKVFAYSHRISFWTLREAAVKHGFSLPKTQPPRSRPLPKNEVGTQLEIDLKQIWKTVCRSAGVSQSG